MLEAAIHSPRAAGRFCASKYAILLLSLLAACASVPVRAPRPAATGAPHGRFRAGVAVADVTPPAGLGTFGHGPEARRAIGHRGRLRCRVIYLEDAAGERVALVPCDFAASSIVLTRAVAERVNASVRLGPERLVMSATHTHGGPAHYFAPRNYNGFFSGEVKGYDPRVVAFLADRIARAIEEAKASAAPARIAWHSARLVGTADDPRSIVQNRSVEAHCANRDPMLGAATTCGGRSADPIAEVEARVDLLRIDVERGGGFEPLGLYATFPVHGTVVPNSNEYFEADLWGFAARYVEARLRGDHDFVAALANGAEADVRPSYARQTWDEARRLGRLLGARIVAAHDDAIEFEDDPRIAVAYRDVHLPRAEAPGSEGVRLCRAAELGRSAPGGSEEGRTDRYGRRWHEGMTRPRRRGCHRPAQIFFGHNLASAGFPDFAALSLTRIGRGALVAYPWEATTTAGLRLRDAVERAMPESRPVALVGLAHDYAQYLTTPEEYEAQHYEGASTIYGPSSLTVLVAHFVELARLLDAGDPGAVRVSAYGIRRPVRRDVWEEGERPIAPRLLADESGPTTLDGRRAYALTFVAGHPSTRIPGRRAWARVERRTVAGRFEPLSDALGDPIDDRHEDVVVEWLGRRRGVGHVHRIRYAPSRDVPSGDYRIVLLEPDGAVIAGTPFTYSAAAR